MQSKLFSIGMISGLFLSLVTVASGSLGFAANSGSHNAAQAPLIVNAAEFGVGKFHRIDNKNHPYSASSAWAPFILPDAASTDQPLVRKNADGSYTIFFSTLDELMASVIQVSNTEHRTVDVLNVHGHGTPGAMWFPKDANDLNGSECSDWKAAASGSDQDNYDQYYSPVPADEIEQIRAMSNATTLDMPCTVGLPEWQAGVQKTPAFKSAVSPNAQMHFLSCVVGMGTIGDAFTKGIAELLLASGQGRIETSMDFGLGDWSMNQGMGFWDYLTDPQLEHDNSIYPVDHKDSEIAQKGSIRLAEYSAGAWKTSQLSNVDFMTLGFEVGVAGTRVNGLSVPAGLGGDLYPIPYLTSIRILGTTKYIRVRANQTK